MIVSPGASSARIRGIPFRRGQFFRAIKDRIGRKYDDVLDEIGQRMVGSEINTSSWIGSGDWLGTRFDPIYRACRCDGEMAGMFLGLAVWDWCDRHPDKWCFGRYTDIAQGLTWFRVG
jgi:hypothetical protein